MGMTYEEGTGTLDFNLLKAEIEALKTRMEGAVGFADAIDDDPAVERPEGYGTVLWLVDGNTPTNAEAGDIIADLNDDTVVVHTP